jgi:hypothetical protein
LFQDLADVQVVDRLISGSYELFQKYPPRLLQRVDGSVSLGQWSCVNRYSDFEQIGSNDGREILGRALEDFDRRDKVRQKERENKLLKRDAKHPIISAKSIRYAALAASAAAIYYLVSDQT